jgi:hypothetical protein
MKLIITSSLPSILVLGSQMPTKAGGRSSWLRFRFRCLFHRLPTIRGSRCIQGFQPLELTPKKTRPHVIAQKSKSLHLALPVASLMISMVPLRAAPEQNLTPSESEQRAMTILKNMSQYLAKAERFSVTIRDGYDAVQQSGQKVEFGEIRKMTVNRPNDLRIEVERSDGEKSLVVFSGKDLTVYTPDKNVYATISKEGTLDQVIQYAVEDLKIRVPLAMMLLSTLPSEVDKLVVSADYVETTTITDVPCDHLAVRTDKGVDFQVWVARGSEPLPRRIVITYKDETGQPQFWADLSSWNLAPEISDTLFTFTPPADADRIQFLAEIGNATVTATPAKGDNK